MKKGCPCNDRNFIGLAGQDRITYTFLTDDDTTPCGCCIRTGDLDPVSGEPVSEVWIKTYHQIRTQEVYRNLKAERAPYTQWEKALRLEERRKIAKEFRMDYGYEPNEETVGYLLEEHWGNRYNLHMDLYDDLDDPYCFIPMADKKAQQAFPGNLPEEVEILREFAATLTGRLSDVYCLMLEKYSGGADPTMGKEIAEKWNVSPVMITKDQDRLKKMIRKYFAEKRKNG